MKRPPPTNATGSTVKPRAGPQRVTTVAELGQLIRGTRKSSGARLVDAAAFAGVGIRFLHELERGKQTAEIGKAFKVLERLGLEVWIVPRGQTVKTDR